MMIVPWLKNLLAITAFFTSCEVHPNESKNERNMFCLECNDNPFCGSCIKSHHKDHRVIQVRRSSYTNVIKTIEIYKHLDILGIQTYVISNFTVVFINKRPYSQPTKKTIGIIGCNSDYLCKTCQRNLVGPYYFCSLACKFECIKKDGGFFLSAKETEEMERLLEESIKAPKQKAKKSREQNLKRKVDEAGINNEENEEDEENEQEERENMLPIQKPNSRRKGIPHRAPFF
ncbi:PLATZ transcription factor family protein [Medicago truncatula]|uniref:PLATZ transcription factor family protein n=2 Tax=Medicago truncatula TaxID=3880 RepID=A0A072VBY3_MEDTR|nr:PLATZ transcription factor family protein [Medicago truncatula]